MKLGVFSFSRSGKKIAETLKSELSHDIETIDKDRYPDGLRANMKKIFSSFDGLVFISSVGIAVRYIAPFVKDKTIDPAVVVIDDLGRYAIPILSGHIGGANSLATELGETIGAEIVVTTASDGRGIDAVDEFAKRYNLYIESMEDVKKLTAMMVDGQTMALVAPETYKLSYPNIGEKGSKGRIVVDYRIVDWSDKPTCALRPRVIYLGIGCRRGKSFNELYSFVKETLRDEGISINSVSAIGSIELKKNEEGLVELAEVLRCEFRTFSAGELQEVDYKFEKNDFVKSKTGVNSVSEACADLMGDELIMKKRTRDGMTLAISRRNIDG